MAYLNRTEIIGHLGKTPDVRNNGQTSKATLSVAVSERYRDRNGETKETTNWFTCVFFGKMAEVIDRLNVEKGTLVYVSGKMNFRTYTKESGEKVNIAELMGDGFQILSARRSDGSLQPTANAPTAEAEEDELPF
jgi:single-strand DNA-binding protein